MKLGSLRLLLSFPAVLLGSLLIGALYPTPAGAQSYCGPVTKVNFAGSLGSNGAYPTGYLTADGQGNIYGTTNGTQGSFVPATIWKYSPTSGLTTLWTFSGPTYANDNIPAVVGSGVTFDSQGNIWGTTAGGGVQFVPASGYGGDGTLYELTSRNGAAGKLALVE